MTKEHIVSIIYQYEKLKILATDISKEIVKIYIPEKDLDDLIFKVCLSKVEVHFDAIDRHDGVQYFDAFSFPLSYLWEPNFKELAIIIYTAEKEREKAQAVNGSLRRAAKRTRTKRI